MKKLTKKQRDTIREGLKTAKGRALYAKALRESVERELYYQKDNKGSFLEVEEHLENITRIPKYAEAIEEEIIFILGLAGPAKGRTSAKRLKRGIINRFEILDLS